MSSKRLKSNVFSLCCYYRLSHLSRPPEVVQSKVKPGSYGIASLWLLLLDLSWVTFIGISSLCTFVLTSAHLQLFPCWLDAEIMMMILQLQEQVNVSCHSFSALTYTGVSNPFLCSTNLSILYIQCVLNLWHSVVFKMVKELHLWSLT